MFMIISILYNIKWNILISTIILPENIIFLDTMQNAKRDILSYFHPTCF